MRAIRLTWALAAMTAVWVADKVRDPGTRPCWTPDKFDHEEQD